MVKNNQRRLYQQIVAQFRGSRHFPVEISDFEAGLGRQVRWTLRACNATDAIRERWVGPSSGPPKSVSTAGWQGLTTLALVDGNGSSPCPKTSMLQLIRLIPMT